MRHINQMTLEELNAAIVKVDKLTLNEHMANDKSVKWHQLCDLSYELQRVAKERAKDLGISTVALELNIVGL